MSDTEQKTLRLGYFGRAALMPLLYPLEAGWVGAESPWKLEVAINTPSKVLDGLLMGEIDAGFVSPVALAQHGQKLAALGGWGVVSEGISSAALLLAPQRLDLMDKSDVALHPEAQGSTAEYLLRLLLKPYYDIELSLKKDGTEGHNLKEARLLYGDRAVIEAEKRAPEWVAEDVGLAMWLLTGMPVVWELMAGRRDLEERKPGAGEALKQVVANSHKSGQEQKAAVLDEAASRLGVSIDKVKEMFGRHRYTLGEKEQKGLAQFLDMASRAGILRPN
ncbi:MAG: MqnA/MqnD/SBP family protein [Chloroflexia bacterium]